MPDGRVGVPGEVAPLDRLAGVDHARGERARVRVGRHPQPVDRQRGTAGVELAGERAELGRAKAVVVGRDERAVHVVPDVRGTPLDPVAVRRADQARRQLGLDAARVRAGVDVAVVLDAEHQPARVVVVIDPEADVGEGRGREGRDELERAARAVGIRRTGVGAVDAQRAAADVHGAPAAPGAGVAEARGHAGAGELLGDLGLEDHLAVVLARDVDAGAGARLEVRGGGVGGVAASRNRRPADRDVGEDRGRLRAGGREVRLVLGVARAARDVVAGGGDGRPGAPGAAGRKRCRRCGRRGRHPCRRARRRSRRAAPHSTFSPASITADSKVPELA